MARRTKKEALATRENIMNAAEYCFSTYGVSGTDMASVAFHANCSRGAIYWHFIDREDLFCAILDRAQPFLSPRLCELLSVSKEHVLDSLWACLDQYLRDIETDEHLRCALSIVIYRCDYSDELATHLPCWLNEQQLLLALICKIFERAHLHGELSEGVCVKQSSALLCFTLMGAIDFFILRQKGRLQMEGSAVLRSFFESLRSVKNKYMIDV
ncbi:TetR family transcriptional regulator [Pseudomonas fulva]|uniref:TetR family transcriptional regulator n=1 Tax=Pseudomonas fulva TaxID=47880 RepID=UPI00201E50B4|nr:TetR family transcriptional regulator [Pseudomonas fulva]UQY33043.1 TetR family transcriptional regulator [Pseudomonas fulva]